MGRTGTEQSPAHHVSSPAQLIGVFVALLGLTAVTVQASRYSLGEFDVWVALGIAGVKATLVAAYFMHLRYDKPLNALLLFVAIIVLVLVLGVTSSDVVELIPEVEAAGR